MPVAMPTWRKVVLIPDAMPLRMGSTTPMAVEASGGLTSPIPTPQSRKPGSSVVHAESTVTPCMSSSPTPTSVRPPPRKPRTGRRSESFPAIGATTNDSSVIGRKRTPASSGEKPSTSWM